MSDIKIQESATDQLAGGQNNETRRGNEAGGTNQFSFCRGQNVEAPSSDSSLKTSPTPNNRENASVSGMNVTGVSVSVKPVDRKTVEGSTPGDFRAKGAPAVLPNQPGPREGMGQVPNGRFCKSAPASQSFTGSNADSDAGN